ncbi:hypothetical protein M9H77_25232 [Catharanthus roseus]|uniref:Uncharacterized protein n=1 Tax=Catharanthus roseus TaxID=4058 RepID=A0ACC0A6J3_CATRO|nr:hypothetical protein M9H77_25232 [Catharanthus roseus]
MRFVDKIQAISAVQKWYIRIGRDNSWSLRNNQSHQGTHMPCSSSSKQASKYEKIISKLISRDPCLERHPRNPCITSDGLYVQEGMLCLEICSRKGFLRIKLKSRDHTVTIYNTREGIYVVKSSIRLDSSDKDIYTLKINEKSCCCGKL